jgi:glutaredoxin-related protein
MAAASTSFALTVGYRGDTKVLYQRCVYRRSHTLTEADARSHLLDPFKSKVVVLYYEPVPRQAVTSEFDLRVEHQRCNSRRNTAGLPPLRREEFEEWYKTTPGSWLRAPEPRAATQTQMFANDWTRIRMQLEAQQVDYVGINAGHGNNDSLRALLWDIAGQKTFPLVFIDNACLGGADAIKQLVTGGSFTRAFSAHQPPRPAAADAGPKVYVREKGTNVALGGYHTIT